MTKILLVADEPWVINDVHAALADRRYSITETHDPRTVTRLLLEDPTDIVVVDMQVGTMGAMAVVRAVRALSTEIDAPPPVVVLLDRDADAFLARRAAASTWVRKPFGAAELRRAIERVGVAVS